MIFNQNIHPHLVGVCAGEDAAESLIICGSPVDRKDPVGADTGPVLALSASFTASLLILVSSFFFSEFNLFPNVL